MSFLQKTKTSQPCTMCRTMRLISEMVDNKNNDDSVNLFCSSSCVMAFMVQSVSSSGTDSRFPLTGGFSVLAHYNNVFNLESVLFLAGARLNCDTCGKNAVPAYHLAMSDTSIRNFCTLQCVMGFQVKKFRPAETFCTVNNFLLFLYADFLHFRKSSSRRNK